MDDGGGVGRSRKKPRWSDSRSGSSDVHCRDYINQQPDDCTQNIFDFLSSPRDRCACSAVSKKWLLLLAQMRGCQFNSLRSAAARAGTNRSGSADAKRSKVLGGGDDDVTGTENGADGEKHEEEASRCLEAKEANDARLAAMAVGTYAMKLLGKLSVRGGFFPSFTQQRITDFGLHIVSQSFPNLKSLSLWDCFNVGSIGLASIAKCCHALEKLEISNLPKIDDDGLVPIARYCPNLSYLTVESCPLVGNRSLQAIAKCSSHLESISITKCPLVGDAGIIYVMSQLPTLSTVRLSRLKLSDAAMHAIGKHRGSIRMLFLEHLTSVTMAGFPWIGLADKLELLSLNSCSGLTDAVLFGSGGGGINVTLMRPTFNCLKQVIIKKCGHLTDVGLKTLTGSANQLTTLKLESCNAITTQGLMVSLRNSRRTLKVLSLVRCSSMNGTTAQEECFDDHPSLDSLTLKRCAGVDDLFLSRMGPTCMNVSRIALIGLTSVTDRGIFSLLKHTISAAVNVEHRPLQALVSLSGCVGITDWSVLAMGRAFKARLHTLSLEGCRGIGDRSLEVIGEFCTGLSELYLSGCEKISDSGVVRLAMAGHSKLEVLSLAGCHGITDRSLGCLQLKCCGLVGLNIQHCSGVTGKCVDSLRSTLWWCDLLY